MAQLEKRSPLGTASQNQMPVHEQKLTIAVTAQKLTWDSSTVCTKIAGDGKKKSNPHLSFSGFTVKVNKIHRFSTTDHTRTRCD
jgi:hypothetical protein